MGSGRSSTEVIQEPQRPIITGTTFSRDYLMSQAGLANQLQADVNKAAENYFANANIGRAAGTEYKPMSFGTFDYTSLLPSEEKLAEQYDQRMAKKEQEKEEKKDDRGQYLNAISKGDPNIFGIPNYKNSKYYQD